MRVYCKLGIVVCLLLLFGCQPQSTTDLPPLRHIQGLSIIDQDTSNNSFPEPQIENKTKEQSTSELIEDTPKTKEHDLNTLIENLKEVYDIHYYNFSRDTSDNDYVRSNNLKYYSVHTNPNQDIHSFNDFCDSYCAQNWDNKFYYINESIYNAQFPLLSKDDFDHENEFKRYVKERILVNETHLETILELGNGTILEFRWFMAAQDERSNFEGIVMPYTLLYKIPCSHNLTIFIKPKWEQYTMKSISGTVSSVIENFILEDERVRVDILEKANQILGLCPVDEDFFESVLNKTHFHSQLKAGWWEYYQKNHMNITHNLSVGVIKKRYHEEYVVNEINISFTNNDFFDIGDVSVEIFTSVDEQIHYTPYYIGKNAISHLRPGKSIVKNVKKKDVLFEHNLTVRAALIYPRTGVEIRPLERTYTLHDLGFVEHD